MKRNRPAFTLLEIVLTIGILSVLLGITATFYRQLYVRNELDVTMHTLVLDLYRAQSLSRNGEKDGQWGVHISTNSITLYRGTNYDSRIVADDEVYQIPSIVSVSGTTDYIFAKFTGLPTLTGATDFTAAPTPTKQISVNQKGVVEY